MHSAGKPYVKQKYCIGCRACAKNCAHDAPWFDENGNPCVKSMPNFGNYFGQRKVVDIQLENGETVTLPVRTANVTVALGAEVDCAEGTGRISNVYVRNQVDCGCNEPEPEVEPKPEPKPVPKIVPEQKQLL